MSLKKEFLANQSRLSKPFIDLAFLDDEDLSIFIKNLKNRKLVDFLKQIPFDESPVYFDLVKKLVLNREFTGRGFLKRMIYIVRIFVLVLLVDNINTSFKLK